MVIEADNKITIAVDVILIEFALQASIVFDQDRVSSHDETTLRKACDNLVKSTIIKEKLVVSLPR